MTKKSVTINLENGLDARPIALLVQRASQHESRIYIEIGDKRVNAKSIMGMMTFISIMNKATAAKEKIDIKINGNDEGEAMDAIVAFFS